MKKLLIGLVLIAAVAELPADTWQNDEGVIRTWNAGTLLPSSDEVAQDASRKTIVLENVQLSEVEVISSQLNANNWPDTKVDAQWVGTAKPYNAVRTVDSLTVDLMTVDVLSSKSSKYNAGRTVFVVLTLVQDGDNVCASVSDARYVDSFNLLGVDLLSEKAMADYAVKVANLATPTSTKPGYGVDQLTFSVRTPAGKKEFDHEAEIAEDAVLDVGTNVAVTVKASAFSGRGSIANDIALAPGGELTFEDLPDETEVKPAIQGNAATIGFRRTKKEHLPVPVVETDPEVINISRIPNVSLATVTNVAVQYGKNYVYAQGWREGVQVWYFQNNGVTATFQAQYKQGVSLRCVKVTMTQEGDDIVLSGFGARSTDNEDFGFDFGTGGGSLDPYTPEREAQGKNYLAIRGVTLYCDTGIVDVGADRCAVKRIYNVSLAKVTNVTGRWGKGLASNNGWLVGPSTYFFSNDGTTATCQIQWLQGTDDLRGEILKLTQSGSDVNVSYTAKAGKGSLGEDLTTKPGADHVPGLGQWGTCIKGLVLYMSEPQTKPVQPIPNISLAAGDLGITNGLVKIDGEMRLSITNTVPDNRPGSTPDFKTTFVPLMVPGGWFELSDGAQLVIEDWGQNAQRAYGVNRCGFRIGPNCLMVLADRNWMLDNFFPYELNGGELRLGGFAPSGNRQINQYTDHIVFKNGSRLTGRSPLVGYVHDGEWYIRGTKPSVCETGVALNGHADGDRWFKLTVDDVTDGESVDFTVEGPVVRGVDDKGAFLTPNCGVWKTGKGTMKLAAACTYSGETKVTEGTLLLGTSQCVLATNKVTVAGGALALAEGTSQAFGIFAFGAGTNTLSIAKGATATFGTMTFGDDVLAINVTGEDASTCVFPRIPARIRRNGLLLNGERAMQDAQGHVVPYEPQGIILLVR